MSDRPRGAASRLLFGLANAIVDRALPRVRAWLKERLGPRADVARATLDGSFIHLDDAVIPLGGDAVLVVARATVTVSSEGLLARGAPQIRLHSLVGEVRAFAQRDDESGFRAPVRFTAAADAGPGEWVKGALVVEGARWPTRHGEGERAPLHGRVVVTVDADGWQLDGGAFTAGAATIALAARGDLDEGGAHALSRARLDFDGARAGHFLDAMSALTGSVAPALDALPWASLVNGSLVLDANAAAGAPAFTGTLTLDGATLAAEGALEPRIALRVTWKDVGADGIVRAARAAGLERMVALGAWSADAPRGTFFVPPDARTSGAVALEGARVIGGDATVATPRSRIALAAIRATASELSLTVNGALACADALAIGLFPGEIRIEPRGTIEGALTLSGPYASMTLAGDVRAAAAGLVFVSRPDVAPLVITDVTGRIALTAASLVYDAFAGAAYGGRFSASGAVTFEPRDPPPPLLRLHFADGGVSLLEALARFATGKMRLVRERPGEPHGPRELWIPLAARAIGEVTMTADGAWTGDVALELPASALVVHFELDPAMTFARSWLRGRVSVADALTFGLFDTTMRPRAAACAPARIDAELGGTLSDPSLRGTADIERIVVEMRDRPALPAFLVTDGRGVFRVDATRSVWKARGKAYEGTVESSGLLGFGGDFVGLQSSIECSDVRLELVPTAADGSSRMPSLVRGRLEGILRTTRRGDDSAPLTGEGSLRVEDAHYACLSFAGPHLAPYGLNAPAPRATDDLVTSIAVTERGWVIPDLRAAVDGVELTCTMNLGFDGSLHGDALVVLDESYLSSSALLALPAALVGSVDVPVTLAGDLGKPVIETGLSAVLGRMLRKNPVTSVIVDVLSTLDPTD